jgi:hypothetical protein
VQRVADFADDKHVERQAQGAGNLRRHNHSPARQAQNQVGLDPLVSQVAAQLLSRVFA